MADTIRVLHVDDEPDFADLTAHSLEREDDRFTVETATSAADALDRLSADIDCIISDYEMPRKNGIELLEAVREEYPDLPFILFTGKGSEEVASDAISAGVTDYLQKESSLEQFTVLANRVTNATGQARAERRLETERQRFQSLFERLTQPTVEVKFQNGEPVVQQVNPAFETVFGYDAAEMVGNSLDAYIIPDGHEDEASRINQRTQSDDRFDLAEVTRRTVDGTRDFLLQSAVYADGSAAFGIYTDISDRKARKRRLERKNARLSELFEQFPEPTIAYVYEDGEPYIEQVNDAFVETFGYEAEAAVGEPVDDLLVPPDRTAEAEQIDRQVRDGQLVDEILCRQTRGGQREFRFRHVLLPDDDTIDGYAIYADVTELQERTAQLREEQRRFQTLFEQLTYPMAEVEYEGLHPIVTDVNPAFEEMFGYDRDAILGESLHETIVPADGRAAAEEISRTARSGDRLSREVTRQAVDGPREFLLESQVYEHSPGGFAMYTDISDRKRREQALSELHDATRRFMDAQSKATVADRAVETARTVLDQPINGLWLYDDETDALEPISQTAEANELVGEQKRYTRGDGLSWQVFEEGTLSVYEDVRTEPGRLNPETQIRGEMIVPLGEYGVMNIGSTEPDSFSEIDVSLARIFGKSVEAALARADREQQLRTQQDTLERQNERLEEFASVVSHDLRNPLRVATSRLELLREESNSDHIDPIDRSLTRIDRIIEDVLWLAREGQDIRELRTVDLENLVTAAWSIAADTTDESVLCLEETGGLGRIEADGERLRQLLENLLRNAVEHGGADVTVTVGMLADGFYIEDDGPGIPPAEREAVFESGYTTANDGTGFGLRIVEQIADAHGWEVSVTDSATGGARFEIVGVTIVE